MRLRQSPLLQRRYQRGPRLNPRIISARTTSAQVVRSILLHPPGAIMIKRVCLFVCLFVCCFVRSLARCDFSKCINPIFMKFGTCIQYIAGMSSVGFERSRS